MAKNDKFVLIADFMDYGGTKTYFLILTHFIIQHHYNLTVYLPKPSVLTKTEIEELLKNNVTVKSLNSFLCLTNSSFLKIVVRKFFELIFFIRIASVNYSKIIVSTGNPFRFFAGCLFFGPKFYYILHTYPKKAPRKKITSLIINGISKIMFLRKSKVITVSQAAKHEILSKLEIKENSRDVFVVHNPSIFPGVESHTFDGQIVLTIGHMEYYKNPSFWLDVAIYTTTKVKTATFKWVGDGSLMEDIRSKIPAEMTHRILLMGRKTNIQDLFIESWVYFQPSLIESHGISVIDAMAHSLPCVVSNRGGLPESVVHNETGYILNLDVKTVAERIILLLNNKEKSQQMGLAGFRKFSKNFKLKHWESVMENILLNK